MKKRHTIHINLDMNANLRAMIDLVCEKDFYSSMTQMVTQLVRRRHEELTANQPPSSELTVVGQAAAKGSHDA